MVISRVLSVLSDFLYVPVVRVLPVVVVMTMAAEADDLHVATAAPMLPDSVLAMMVDVTVPAAPVVPVDTAERASPVSSVAPMVVTAFAVAVVPTAPVLPALAPATPVAMSVELPVATLVALSVVPGLLAAPVMPSSPSLGPPLRDTMVQNKKCGLPEIYLFT